MPICEASDQKDHQGFHKHSWFIYFVLKQEKKSSQDKKPKQRIQCNKKVYPQRRTHNPTAESQTEVTCWEMLSKTGVNQTTMFEGKCNWEGPYWRCLTAPHQWLDLKECQRDLFHTQLLKRKGAFFVPVTGDPGSHGCSKLPCSISSMAFTG